MWQMSPATFFIFYEVNLQNNDPIPITIRTGNASERRPPATMQIKTIGRRTTVNNILVIPQAALIEKINNLPNIIIIRTIKINVHII